MCFVSLVVGWGSGRKGSGLAECAVRPVVVVMVLVLAKHGCGVPQVDDEDPVEEFASDAADEAFGDRVGSRCPHRCLDDADAERGEHGVERCGELSVTVPVGCQKSGLGR